MLYSDISSQLGNVLPPAQPDLVSKSRDYKKALIKWHPTSTKNLALFSEFTTRPDIDNDVVFFPDGCVKFIFDCNDNSPQATITGIYSEKDLFKTKPNTTYFVVMPYCFKGLKCKIGNNELMDKHVDFSDVFPEKSIVEQIAECDGFGNRIDLFLHYSNQYLIDDTYSSDFTEYSAVKMCLSGGTVKINDLGEDLGYSEGYFRAKFRQEFGISPKRYSRILRFQNVLHMLDNQSQDDISNIVYNNGFFDQTHFIKDFKHFTSSTPVLFNNNYYLN